MEARLPDDENERLAALQAYEILGGLPDPRLDVLVRLTADLFRVPMTAVSLIDEARQVFKSRIGLAADETPRSMAFCAHAILTPNEVTVVEDATADPRFCDNPLVTGEPDIRFYAGAPINSPSGHALGTLCVIDTVPRTLNPEERQRLADLARTVGSVLDLHQSTLRLERAATHDRLTGIANRALFEPELEAAVQKARAGSSCAVLCLDLDGFEGINDRFGHAGGDAILVQVAQRMSGVVRSGDLIARLGGDEFAVLMTGPLPAAAPVALAKRLMTAFAKPFHIGDTLLAVASSIGLAVCPTDATGAGSLLRAADEALYHAKRIHQGRIVCFADLEARPMTPEDSLLADLRHATTHGEFVHHFQPVYDLASGRIVGHEALIRWDRPHHGPVSPSEFIALAEETGLIAEIDTWSLEAVCAAAAAWPFPHEVAVNLSAVSFALGGLPRLVGDVLERTGLAPGRLVIELTERTLIEHGDVFASQLVELHTLGVRLSLDDFGIGYSSLAYLRRFNFDIVKLDRAFVEDLTTDARADAITHAILSLAGALGMQVCAEGIETDVQLQFLRTAGCQFGQGYRLGRPGAVPRFQWAPD